MVTDQVSAAEESVGEDADLLSRFAACYHFFLVGVPDSQYSPAFLKFNIIIFALIVKWVHFYWVNHGKRLCKKVLSFVCLGQDIKSIRGIAVLYL